MRPRQRDRGRTLHLHAHQTIAQVDVILSGSGTYRLLAPHWSRVAEERSGTDAENTFARTLADTPKILFSASIKAQRGWNTQISFEDPSDVVRRLGPDTRAVVQASPGLARSLRRAELVHELRLLLQPIVAGKGPSLFDDDEHPQLTLIGATPHASGAVALDYTLRYS